MPAASRTLAILLLSLLSLLSAFLLFQVQPVISKFILPWFGGSPGVWTTCMLFFQIVLFLGYTYAHALGKLPGHVQFAVHASLLVAALFLLPIAPSDAWKPGGAEDPGGRILLLLLTCVGLPYFVLSSTSPLVQVWFTRGMPGASPWRLYALSNIGSLAALLTFPFFFEPRWDVVWLTKAWSVAFVAYVALSVAALWLDRRSQAREAATTAETSLADEPPSLWRRFLWIALPALASVMLLATTNHVCQDVAVIPFMWVVPLSLYLITFIICFEHERWYESVPALWVLPALPVLFVTITWDQLEDQSWWPSDLDLMSNYLWELGWAFGGMFLACMICHGELTRLKPSPRRLTSFYLHMSAGGALGGLFVSLGAPLLFKTHAEWQIGSIAVFVLACAVLGRTVWRLRLRAVRNFLCAVVGLLAAAGASFMVKLGFKFDERLERVRNFYGTLAVTEWFPGESSHSRELSNGGIIHGTQNLSPERRGEPTSYYGHDTGIGKALDSLQHKNGARVGVVGMGAGTVATYGKSGDTFRFYDINPDVPRLAQKYFTYLPDLQQRGAKLEIVVSDARLALERELSTPQNFDVLLLDAFSGDSVPAHLLTLEAFEIYKKHMRPDGIIAVHVTNSYLLLAPLIEKTAAALGYKTTRVATNASYDGEHDSTDYVLVTNNETFLAATPPEPPDDGTLEDEAKIHPRVWTDRHHDLFQILMLNLDEEEEAEGEEVP